MNIHYLYLAGCDTKPLSLACLKGGKYLQEYAAVRRKILRISDKIKGSE